MTGWVMNVEQLVECELAGEIETLTENLPHFHFTQYKFRVT
jgi:hypothetical protein